MKIKIQIGSFGWDVSEVNRKGRQRIRHLVESCAVTLHFHCFSFHWLIPFNKHIDTQWHNSLPFSSPCWCFSSSNFLFISLSFLKKTTSSLWFLVCFSSPIIIRSCDGKWKLPYFKTSLGKTHTLRSNTCPHTVYIHTYSIMYRHRFTKNSCNCASVFSSLEMEEVQKRWHWLQSPSINLRWRMSKEFHDGWATFRSISS